MLLSFIFSTVGSGKGRVFNYVVQVFIGSNLRAFFPFSIGLLSHLFSSVNGGTIARIFLFRVDRIGG